MRAGFHRGFAPTGNDRDRDGQGERTALRGADVVLRALPRV